MVAQGIGCGLLCAGLGRRVPEKAGGNELQSARRKINQKNDFSYIAVEEKAVVNDNERYMTKLMGAIPNKLEDARFIFMGNYSPERVGYSQAKKQRGHIPGSFVCIYIIAAGHAFGTQIMLGLV